MARNHSSGLPFSRLNWLSKCRLGNGLVKTAIIRNVIVGIITMIIHYSLGMLLQA